MLLSEVVYDVLKSSVDDILPLEVEDIIRNSCLYRSFLQMIREERDHDIIPPQEIFLRETANGFRDTFQDYMRGSFKDRYTSPSKLWCNGSVLVRYEGLLDGTPVFLETLPSKKYSQGGLPKYLQNVIAARSYILGSEMAYVLVLDRNTQGWKAWQFSGDFSAVGDLVTKNIDYINGLIEGCSEGVGIRSECDSCPYKSRCDVGNHVSSPDPFPQTRYKLNPDLGLITELEKYLWSLNKQSTGRKTHVIHPSELTTSKCDRAIAYGLQGVAERRKVEPGLRRIFDMGHATHDLIQMAIKYKFGDEADLEAPCAHDHLKIYGSCDVALKKEAVEIKTISCKGYEKLSKPKPEHEDQTTIYAEALGKDGLRFLYVNKDSGMIKEFDKKVSRQRWHRLATRASRILKAVSEGVLPEQIDKPYICKVCKYAWHCKPEITESRKFRR